MCGLNLRSNAIDRSCARVFRGRLGVRQVLKPVLLRKPGIYFLSGIFLINGESIELIKIGKTIDLIKRMYTLNHTIPVVLNLLHFIPLHDDQITEEEKRWHREFSEDRYHGEWFYSSRIRRTFVNTRTSTCN